MTDLLVKNFEEIFDPAYTARLEEELDEIEEGKEKWTDALGGFYKKFSKDLRYAEKHMENVKRMEKPTDEKCERCGSPLVLKWGKHGSFYACSSYKKDDPESCTFTKENPINLPELDTAEMPETGQDEYCENCGRVMVLKRGRFGQFMACTGYPDCKTTRRLDQGKRVPDVPLEELCPKCNRNMVLRHGRYGEFISCSGYPECKYIKQNFIGVKVPAVRGWRTGGEEGPPPRQHFLWVLELSEVRVHVGIQAGGGSVSGMRQPVPAGEAFEVRIAAGLSEQQQESRRMKKSSPSQRESRAARRARQRPKKPSPRPSAVKCDYSRSIPTPEWMTQGKSGEDDEQREAV